VTGIKGGDLRFLGNRRPCPGRRPKGDQEMRNFAKAHWAALFFFLAAGADIATPAAAQTVPGACTAEGCSIPVAVAFTGTDGSLLLPSVGFITSTPAGISCGTLENGGTATACAATLRTSAGSTRVVLTALRRDTAYEFSGWTGDCTGNDAAVSVEIGTRRVISCQAVFRRDSSLPDQKRLIVGVVGTDTASRSATVTSSPSGISCTGTGISVAGCSASFTEGATVTLRAAPPTGVSFVAWTGSCSGTTATATVTMSENKTCVAHFAPSTLTTRSLAVTLAGQGSGRVTSTPAGIACTKESAESCAGRFDLGTTVTLNAIADTNSRFAGWSGRCSGTTAATTITLTDSGTCTATFDRTSATTTVQAGWWWGPAEAGRGYGVETGNGRLFLAAYMYRDDGTPVWYVANGPMTGNSYTGALTEFTGTQTLTSPGGGTASAVSPSQQVTITFTSETQGTIQWQGGVFGSSGATTAIRRFPVTGTEVRGSALVGAPETGWWYNAAEAGTGYFMEQQGTALFLAAYMYDSAGKARWYYAQGTPAASGGVFGSGSGVTMSASLMEARGGQTLTSGPRTTITSQTVGQITLTCSSSTSCSLTLPGGRAVALVRYTSF